MRHSRQAWALPVLAYMPWSTHLTEPPCHFQTWDAISGLFLTLFLTYEHETQYWNYFSLSRYISLVIQISMWLNLGINSFFLCNIISIIHFHFEVASQKSLILRKMQLFKTGLNPNFLTFFFYSLCCAISWAGSHTWYLSILVHHRII